MICELYLNKTILKEKIEINKTENRKTIEKINGTKSWFSEKQ